MQAQGGWSAAKPSPSLLGTWTALSKQLPTHGLDRKALPHSPTATLHLPASVSHLYSGCQTCQPEAKVKGLYAPKIGQLCCSKWSIKLKRAEHPKTPPPVLASSQAWCLSVQPLSLCVGSRAQLSHPRIVPCA